MKLKIAACQFPLSGDIAANAAHIKSLMKKAARRGADCAHFCETALSGYMGHDVPSWKGYDWDLLSAETRDIMRLACRLKIWVILGSSHRLTGNHLPHNCLYVIDSNGKLVNRYDKRFCTPGDLRYYTPGDHFVIVPIKGVKCGLLICFDARFPEVFRKYKQLGADVIAISFYNAKARPRGRNIHTIIIRPTLQGHAASNSLWISAVNSATYYQSWPGVFIQPDGELTAQLRANTTSLMINTIDTAREFYDLVGDTLRKRVAKGILNTGRTVRDVRSRKRTIV